MKLKTQLDDAKESLRRLREEYKDDPELLACYEPSAIYLVKALGGMDGNICESHKVAYISVCPTCEFEKNYKKDKHTYRQFKRKE